MSNRIVSEKEFRNAFRSEAVSICDFSNKKSKHLLGSGPKQISVDVGAVLVDALIGKYQRDGRTLDKSMVHMMTPKGARAYASLQLNQIGKVKFTEGANAIEAVWKSLGDIIPVARIGRANVFVAKNGATEMELASVRDLRTGKLNARIAENERLVKAIDDARTSLSGRNLGEAYADTCTQYFQLLEAAE